MPIKKKIATWLFGDDDVGKLGLHESFVIRQIRYHRKRGADVQVIVFANDEQSYSVRWGSHDPDDMAMETRT